MAYSYQNTVANGISTLMTVPFPYLDKTHVHVFENGVEVNQATITWTSPSTLLLPAIPTAGTPLRVQRITPISPDLLVRYVSGFLSHDDLNLTEQGLQYAIQEIYDISTDGLRLSFTDSSVFDAKLKRLSNVGDPQVSHDAATKGYVDTADTAVLSTAKAYADAKSFGNGSLGSTFAGFKDPVLIGGTINPVTIYVRKTGSDSNLGLSDTAPLLTIGTALSLAFQLPGHGGNVVIDVGAGDWAEDILVSGTVTGNMHKAPIPNIGIAWPSMIVIQGVAPAGAIADGFQSTTVISGTGSFGATIIASNMTILGLKNVTVTGNKNGFQSCVFAQLGAYVNIFGGCSFGAAAAEQLHAENSGTSIQIWEDYSFTGGGSSAMAVSDQAEILISAGIGHVFPTVSYSTGFIFMRSGGSIQSNIAVPFENHTVGAPGGPIGGFCVPFVVVSGAVLEISNVDLSDIPGIYGAGYVQGGYVRAGGLASAIVPVSASTGTGSTGTTVLKANSTPRCGQIIITPGGTGISSGGQIDLTPKYAICMEDSNPGYAMAAPAGPGTGSWDAGAYFQCTYDLNSNRQPTLTINWSNNGVALVAGLTYPINYLIFGSNGA